MEDQTHIGVWWLPSQPDIRLHGTFSFSAKEGSSLALTGNFHSLQDFAKFFEEPIILGASVNGKPITLFHCIRTQNTFSTGGIPTSTYRARFALIGHHFPDSESIAFHQYRISYLYLEQWIAQALFNYTHEDSTSTTRERHIVSYTVPDDITANLGDEVVTLTSRVSVSMGWATQPSISHSNAFKVDSPKPVPLLHFLESTSFLLQNFLALGIGRATRPLEIIARREDIRDNIGDERTVPRDITILQRIADMPSKEVTILPHEMLFSFSDIAVQFENILKQWFQRESILRPVYHLYFATINNSSLYGEDEFLNYIYALESYHRRTRPGKYLDEPAIEQVRQALTNAIPESAPPDLRTSLNQKLRYINEFSLRRRLKELLRLLPNAVSLFIPDHEVFVEAVVNTRNYMTHYDQSLENKTLTGEQLYWATRKLQAILQIRFLVELGFADDHIRKIVESRNAFSVLRGK